MFVQHAWTRVALALAFAAFAAYAVVVLTTSPASGANAFVTLWLYQGLIAFAAVVTGVRALTATDDRLAWSVVTAALAVWSAAEVYYTAADPVEYPSPADYGWLAFYPLMYAGIVLLVRRRARSAAGALWLDGATATLAAAALGAAVLVEVVLGTTEGSRAAVATTIAYPLGDVLLLSAVFGVFSLAGWRLELRWALIGLGMLATAVADGVYLFTVDTYQAGTEIDVLWPASALLIAAAAWLGTTERRELDVEGRPLLAVPASAALVAIAVLVTDHFHRVNVLAVALAAGTALLVVLRLVLTFLENRRLFALTRHEAITDSLTELGNRRKLVADLESRLTDTAAAPSLLMLFDLDGFKGYNDTFGHPAGDALLVRLAAKLEAVAGADATAYRLGGDEFCLIAPVSASEVEALIDRACSALTERGEGFEISSSFGAIMLPDEAQDASEALHLADERLYAQKHSRRADSEKTMHALLDALAEREPGLHSYAEGVASLAVETGRLLGLRRDELEELSRAAQLHDLGKLAVPDEILSKPEPLDDREWDFIHQHTLVGERILRASPAFRSIAGVVRSSHERWDGTGYPDGLAGDDIPLASRIVCAADAYAAMTSPRPYRPPLLPEEALAELERGAGAQFDPRVVAALVAHLRDQLAERAA